MTPSFRAETWDMWSPSQRMVQKNRDWSLEELMFVDAIINVTVVWSRTGPSVAGAERGAGAIDQHTPHEQRDFYYDTVAGAASAFPVMSLRKLSLSTEPAADGKQ